MVPPIRRELTEEDKLFQAVMDRNVDALNAILKAGKVNVNAMKPVDMIQSTVLYVAALYPCIAIVQSLLAVPTIDVNLPNRIHKNATTPLMRSIEKGNLDTADVLIGRHDTMCNAVTDVRPTIVVDMSLASYNRAAIVPKLWPRLSPALRAKCMSEALKAKSFEVVAALIEVGCKFEVTYNNSVRPDALLIAAVAKHVTIQGLVGLLLQDLPFLVVDDDDDIIADNPEYMGSWSAFVLPGLRVSDDVRKEVVIDTLLSHAMFHRVPRQILLEQFVYAKDIHGRTAFDTTETSVKEHLQRLFFFMQRYEFVPGPAAHVSATSVVRLAYDHGICHQVFHELADQLNVCLTLKHLVDKWDAHFEYFAKDFPGYMTEAEFKKFCDMQYGRKIQVALKFMRREEDYTKEVEVRRLISTRGHVSKYMLNMLPSPSPDEFERAVGSLSVNNDQLSLADFKHVLVLPAADRSLEDIFFKERPSANLIRFLLEEAAHALRLLHSWDIMHGDVKKLNFVRVKHQLKLIDLDAATVMNTLMGSKFSSGVLPPEMFHHLETDDERSQYMAYWADDIRIRDKLRPRSNIVVKCFRQDGDYNQDAAALLPYAPVVASPEIDIWALGVMMFQLWSGEELVATDINEDVTSGQIQLAKFWTPELLKARIRLHIDDEDQLDLLSHVLAVDPKDRWSLESILQHPYFNP
ncbi:hypothetical protein DYB38_006629 [Aphanomyces astaci]|uniref:Protein kinase domain-containing protein n=2 Tax=Aphanomyces astaci TaxID=112090 RepID=A0A397DPJ8_APHAT|nr:hypothetical protein DYB38_006629 [Aphanomyces astaci]